MLKSHLFIEKLNLFLLSIGAIIGVGFLSGAEIWVFFARFGDNFYIAIIVIFLLLYYSCEKIILDRMNFQNLSKLQKNKLITTKFTILNINKIKHCLLNIEIFFFSGAMFSGLKNIIYELFDSNQFLIFIMIIFIVFVLMIKGNSFISKANNLIVLCFFIISLFLIFKCGVFKIDTIAKLSIIKKFGISGGLSSIFFAVTYIFMNISHLVPIFDSYKTSFSKKDIKIFSFLFSLVFCFLLFIFVMVLAKYSYLSAEEMPLFNFFKGQNRGVSIFFSITLLGCLLSTSIICLMGVTKMFEMKIKNRFFVSYFSVFLPLILSFLPFNFFINFVYPVAGIINFLVLIFL